MSVRRSAATFLVAALWSGSVAAAETVFPGASWEEAEPQSQWVDAALLDDAMVYLESECGEHGTTQAMVIRNGYLIWKGSDIDSQHNVWSVSKSFTSTVLGLLVDDGACTPDTLAADHVATLQTDYGEVRLRHFATMTSGYDGGGDQSSTPFMPTAPLFAAGTEFQYWDSAMNEFANVLTHIAGEPIEDLFRGRIADPIGMNPDAWDWGDFGTVDGLVINGGAGNKSNGIHISAADLARLGHLFLNRGNWNGTQLISESWVDQASGVQVAPDIPAHTDGAYGPGVYGFNWWVNGMLPDQTRYWPNAPEGTYAARGFNNNQLFVVPKWNMVIVRLGVDGSIDNEVYDTFFGLLADAVMDIPGGTTGTDGGGSDDGASGTGGDGSTTTSASGATSVGDADSGATGSGGFTDGGGEASGSGDADDSGGCGCRTRDRHLPLLWIVMGGAVCARRGRHVRYPGRGRCGARRLALSRMRR